MNEAQPGGVQARRAAASDDESDGDAGKRATRRNAVRARTATEARFMTVGRGPPHSRRATTNEDEVMRPNVIVPPNDGANCVRIDAKQTVSRPSWRIAAPRIYPKNQRSGLLRVPTLAIDPSPPPTIIVRVSMRLLLYSFRYKHPRIGKWAKGSIPCRVARDIAGEWQRPAGGVSSLIQWIVLL